MISFSCSHCDMKLKVKPEFAGRSSKCPTCKHPLVVPQPDRTDAHVPAGQIDGTASSVHQAGVDGGVTLGDVARGGQKSVRELLAKGKAGGQRYVIEKEIARGGMGAVLRAIDRDLRRVVAVKFMLDEKDPKKKARFVEEAQITGQLEHPNIVPIHELGVDAKGRLFFVMKMVQGRSLAQVLDELRNNAKVAEKEYSLSRLLNIFVNVCHPLAYAHSRGVVHRDLKPANIMLGDFGEVQVMDWGLAKVVGQEAPPVASVVAGSAITAPAAVTASGSGSGVSSRVSTSREADADLTQEGAIVGTPVYMPPEQAMGEIGEIDQRSDVYSLGAILYEILTLVPPIEKDGGYLNILMRVSEGDIKQPEVRAPQRVSRIPRELSAIAMKALAKDKKDRYQTVEELRRDIERFQEGRSVSAKEDTKWELAWKLAKRNKMASAFTVVLGVVLLWGSWINLQARLEAEKNNVKYLKAQEEKRAQGKKSVPALVKAARFSANDKDFDDALNQVNVALDYDPDREDALLLKGQMLIGLQRFTEAQVELDKCLTLRPDDAAARRLADLCRRVRPDDSSALLALADELARQKAFTLSDLLTRSGTRLLKSREELLAHLRKRIEAAWPGMGHRLQCDETGRCSLNANSWPDVKDLAPLAGMPLVSLSIGGCTQVHDLSPLKGMKLTTLDISGCQVRDLTPLIGMKLTTLQIVGCPVRDFAPLRDMPLTKLNLDVCAELEDLTPFKGAPLALLSLQGCRKVTSLTTLQGMPLTWLNLENCNNITDLTPLNSMPLTWLNLVNCPANPEPVRSIKTLATINRIPAAEFWKQYDAKQKAKK